MAMNNEQAGEQVFANVDHALAGRIISRSRENSKEAKPVVGGNTARPGVGGTVDVNISIDDTIGTNDYRLISQKLIPVVKIAAALFAFLILAKLFFGRKGKGRD